MEEWDAWLERPGRRARPDAVAGAAQGRLQATGRPARPVPSGLALPRRRRRAPPATSRGCSRRASPTCSTTTSRARSSRVCWRSAASSAPGPGRGRPGTAYVMVHHKVGDVGEDGDGLGAWGFPEGGMGGVTSALRSAASSFGAEVRTGAAVDRIVVAQRPRDRRRARLGRGAARARRDRHDPPEDHLPPAARPGRTAGRLRHRHRALADPIGHRQGEPGPRPPAPLHEPPRACPDVYGGTIVLAPSLDHVERAFQDAVAGRPADATVRRHLHPERVRPDAGPRGPPRHEHVHAVGAARVGRRAPPRRAGRLRRPGHRADGGGGAGLHERRSCTARSSGRTRWSTRTASSAATSSTASCRPGSSSTCVRCPGTRTTGPRSRGLYMAGSATHGGGGVTGIPALNVVAAVRRDRRRARILHPRRTRSDARS